jgi:LuxR family maltose regulon positive regulatory protein
MQLDLHARVSLWYEKNGYFYQAVEHAFLSQDNNRAACLIDETADYLLGKGEHTWLFKQIQKLPQEQIRGRLRLPVYQAAILASNGNMEEAEQCLQHLERYLPSSSLDVAELDWLTGRAASIRALIAICRGDIASTQKYAQLAAEKLPQGDDSFWRSALFITLSNLYLATGDLEAASQNMFEAIRVGKVSWQSFVVLDAMTQLAMVLWARGQLNKAAEVSQEGLRLVRENRLENLPMAGMLYLGLGFVLSEQNKLDEAEKYIRRGLELCQNSSKLWSLVWAEQVWMRLLMAKNDLPAAEAVAREADRMAQENQIPAWITSVNSGLHARIWVKMGRLDEAARYLQEHGICAQGEIQHPHQAEYHALASLFIARGEPERAIQLLERVLAYYTSTQQRGLAIGAQVLQALAFQAAGNLSGALSALDLALQAAEPEGFIQIFLNEGEPVNQLLGEALRHDLHPEYVRLLLARYAAAYPEETSEKNTPDHGELSAREFEVLRLIAAGLTNKEIALKLGISLRTVKFHTTSIFTRLNVENRTQAVTRAQALGLL